MSIRLWKLGDSDIFFYGSWNQLTNANKNERIDNTGWKLAIKAIKDLLKSKNFPKYQEFKILYISENLPKNQYFKMDDKYNIYLGNDSTSS